MLAPSFRRNQRDFMRPPAETLQLLANFRLPKSLMEIYKWSGTIGIVITLLRKAMPTFNLLLGSKQISRATVVMTFIANCYVPKIEQKKFA